MEGYSLNVSSKSKGIYLSTEQMDLLSIVQCNTYEELKTFILECGQFKYKKEQLDFMRHFDLETLKRVVFKIYQKTLIDFIDNVKDWRKSAENRLNHCDIDENTQKKIYIYYGQENFEAIKNLIREKYPERYDEIITEQFRFLSNEMDQIKSVNYDEIVQLNRHINEYDTILIISGKRMEIVNPLGEEGTKSPKYDWYKAKRDLEFCKKNGKSVRYHTLLDKNTFSKFSGKSKEEIIRELKEYVKKNVDFINEYNKKNKIIDKNGKEIGVIREVDLFNEIVSFDKNYRGEYINIWEEEYGITIKDLMEIFQYALDNKPEGVRYLYNEPFLENPERRKKVISVLEEMNKVSPGLIDTLGTQMHITMLEDEKGIEECFKDFKNLQSKGTKIEITEFDMCLPEKFLFNDKFNKAYPPKSIKEGKKEQMRKISKIIRDSGVELEGITYWSLSDKMDHNVERTNRETILKKLNRPLIKTRYGGLYGELKDIEERELY